MANSDTLYDKLTATDIVMKGSPNSSDRDAGFCSGSSEGGDDLSIDNSHSRLEPSSPTDASEDSVEVKVTPISFTRNKRKSTEPSKVISGTAEQLNGPLKKRIRYQSEEFEKKLSFRPWNAIQQQQELMPNPAEIFVRHPGVTTLHLASLKREIVDDIQDEPLALVAKKPPLCLSSPPSSSSSSSLSSFSHQQQTKPTEILSRVKTETMQSHMLQPQLTVPFPSETSTSSNCSSNGGKSQRPPQRNYKNMTRERRIEANARERTRVHTISAAYETLRKSIPAYSNTQKLSKLSVLRVACSYILTLSRMAGYDYSEDGSEPSILSCVEAVTKTIQTEGKIRKKKDE